MSLSCLACGAENEPAARFCNACGEQLARQCVACGEAQPPSAAFCSQCGTALDTSARGPVDDREERRVVTVLFADLVGSTTLAERLDPEDVRVVQKELFELVSTEVERYGGVCEKFVGDAVLAVFGIPQAHEDDAERAVRAALAIQRSFERFARGLGDRYDVSAGMRVGVNTGEVVAGRTAAARGELIVSGDVVNVAARLQQEAVTGQILVGPRTRLASARVIAYEEAGARVLRGKQQPVEAWQPVGVAAVQPVRGFAGLSAPLIGRGEELAALEALALRAERERTPQLVTLLGAAGIGKSRLLAELAGSLRQATVLRGRCLPYAEGVAYWPVAEMAKEQAGILDTDAADVAREKLSRHVGEVMAPEWSKLVTEVAAWTIGLSLPHESEAMTSGDVTRRLHDAWVRYVSALGRRNLTLVAFEDVHWASTPLLDLLEHLAGALDDTAVLLACTSRPELMDRRATWGAAAGNSTSLTLGSLTEAESDQLVGELLGRGALDQEQRARVLARAEGNPFFVEEILQMLVDRGVIERGDDGWVLTQSFDAGELPDSVHGVIAARIDLLDPEAREALRRCSVIGRVFWPAAVGVDDETIAALAPRGLVGEQDATTMARMREFRFKHALTRDVAYGSLPRPERRTLHRRVADWIQQVAPGREAEMSELAAHHLVESIELGDRDPAVRRRAFELLVAAGEAALARGAMEPARHHLVTAFEMATSTSERGVAQLALGRLELLDAIPSVAVNHLEQALEAAEELGDDRLRGRALGVTSRVYWLLGRQSDARAAAAGAVEALRGFPGSADLAWALARRSQLEMLAGSPGAADSAREAIAVSRTAGEGAAEANARINLLTASGNVGVRPDVDEVRAIVALALESGVSEEAYRAIVNFIWSGHPFIPVGELEGMVSGLRSPLEHVPPLELFGSYLELSYATNLFVPCGRWADADRIIEANPSRQWTTARIVWCEVAGGLAFRRGDIVGATPVVEELAELALPSLEAQRIVPAACVIGGFAIATGRSELLHRVLDAVHSVTQTHWAATFGIAPLCRALAHADETAELARIVSVLEERAVGASPVGHHRVSLATGVGLLALHDGRAHDAVTALTSAAEIERALERVVPAACIELDLARALEEAGNDVGAASVRRGARAVLEPLGCVNAY